MKEIVITSLEAGQRMDRLLGKYLREAPKSFLYKMMRKKNITLNGKKAEGSEKLREGDVIRLFFPRRPWKSFQAPGRKYRRQTDSTRTGSWTYSTRTSMCCL